MTEMMPYLLLGEVGKPLLVMLAGFPDNCTSTWGPETLENLAKDYRVISLCLPGYDKPRSNIRPWGWDLHEVLDVMHHTLTELLKVEQSKTFNLIVHDWGAFFGMCYQNAHPEIVKKIVLFDIGMIKKPPIQDGLRILFYQNWFALSFFISQLPPISIFKCIGDACMIIYKMLFYIF